jgi:hypothetical protein
MTKYIEIAAPIGNAWLTILEGVVTSHQTQRWSTTTVQSSGGGGYVNPTYGGYVAPPTISTKVTQHEKTEFWVQDADGKQQQFSFPHNEFPVAQGHRVRIVWGGSTKNKDKENYLFAHNLTSGHRQYFDKLDGLYSWPFNHKLIEMPILFRAIFFLAPALIWCYLTLAWIIAVKDPLISFLIILGSLFGWAFTTVFWSWIGWLFYGRKWARKFLYPFRDRLFQAYDMPL